jgi:hypothetical protein
MSHVRLDKSEHCPTHSDLCGARTTYRHLTGTHVKQNAHTNFQFDPTWEKITWTDFWLPVMLAKISQRDFWSVPAWTKMSHRDF